MTRRSRIVVSPRAATRLRAAEDWLRSFPADAEILIVAPTWEAADDLARSSLLSASRPIGESDRHVGGRAGAKAGSGSKFSTTGTTGIAGSAPLGSGMDKDDPRPAARFGTSRMTLDTLAARLAAPELDRRGLVPASGLSFVAIVARAVHRLVQDGALAYFGPVASRPGFAAAVAATLRELRMNGAGPDAVRPLPDTGAELATLAEGVARELADAGLADRALVYEAAARSAEAERPPHPVGVPVLLLDLPVWTRAEARFIAALAHLAPDVFATAAAGDATAIGLLEEALDAAAEPLGTVAMSSLLTLQTHLFEETTPTPAPLDESVVLSSWPGEARECVEIARGIREAAARGVPFDRMAVFLRSPGEYRPHLEEAFRRAAIPAYFARGTSRPDPAGRALLALLACAVEGLSARRFGEYLSLAQMPEPQPAGGTDRRWIAPQEDLLRGRAPSPGPAMDDARPPSEEDPLPNEPYSDRAAVHERTVPAPWRWEALIVDASVIGGEERWERRLAGLEQELRLRRADVEDEESTLASLLDRQLADLRDLHAFALPLIKRLRSLPASASWGVWLEQLRDLCDASLREPENILATLTEIAPMAPVGPVDLDEVRIVLGPRLRELTIPPPRRRYGAVYVAPAESARGTAFDVVFVPGLAERLFPRRILEDPILLDAPRRALEESGAAKGLATQPVRASKERLFLRLAAGAARERLVLSYPRLDVEQARSRVPSFYGLEALRAAEGRLSGFDDLSARARSSGRARLGWPAPERPEEAIDEAEFDLAVLAPLLDAKPDTTAGAATYLLSANPALARALRARARRWNRRWSHSDGLVDPDAAALEALSRHRLDARSYSPTALQNFAACPYKFYLQAILRLAPREEPVAIEALDPLTRGALFHEVQFSVLTGLRERGLLPVTGDSLAAALALVDEVFREVEGSYRDRLAPAIDRVWDDSIASLRADVREWLRRASESKDGWIPHRFELGFGLADRARQHADPSSAPSAVPIVGGLKLRGSIDLVERRPGLRLVGTAGEEPSRERGASLRVTDHKTGKVRAKADVVVGGGEVLQPVLYALAAEQILGEPVEEGRLYYCTADGGYVERKVPIDARSREAAATVVEILGRALDAGFFPAAPASGACTWCDYRPVCGPFEEIRVGRKPADRLADLKRLRELP